VKIMDTGQLFMQLSARAKVDFSMPVNTSTIAKPVMKKESGTFDGVLRNTAPKNYGKTEQPARTEVKRPAVKDVERKEEPVRQQKPEEVSSKSSDQVKVPDNNIDQVVEKKSESKLSEVQDVKTIPQNVDTSAVVAAATLVQPLFEGRMPQIVDAEADSGKIDGLVRAQNAITELPLPEGKQLQAETAKADPGISKENVGTQNAANEIMFSAVEVAAGIMADKNQVQVELLAQNSVFNGVLMQQPVNLQAGATIQETKTTELAEVQTPLTPVIAAGQNLVVEGQAAVAKTDSDTKTVGDVGQQSDKLAAVRQKAVFSQDPVKTAPVKVTSEAAIQNTNDVLLQTSASSPASVSTADFKFSRSASVEASLGMASAVFDQPQEKLAVSVPDSAKAATGNASAEAMPAEFSGSESGFSGKDNGGFGQQNLDLPKPGLQQMTNGQVVSTANISTGNAEQIDVLQQPKMASSENVAGQVKAQLSTREIKQGSEQITIQLSPDHLGDIKVNFRLEDQRLRVEIVAENRNARESLLQHADSLKESLARQNINMEKFEVTGGNNGNANQGGNSQPEWREMAKNRQSQQWLAAGGYRTRTAELNPSLPVYFARAEKSTLDLHF
jgi:flagellar hook-length control protein FliK